MFILKKRKEKKLSWHTVKKGPETDRSGVG